MMKSLYVVFLCLILSTVASAQQLDFPLAAVSNSDELSKAMPVLARTVMDNYKEDDRKQFLSNLLRLQIVAGEYADANATIKAYRQENRTANYSEVAFIQYEIFALAKLKQATTTSSFEQAFEEVFNDIYGKLSDKVAYYASTAFLTRAGIGVYQNRLQELLDKQKDKNSIALRDALALCRAYNLFEVYKTIEPLAKPLLSEDNERRYIIQDDVLIKTKDGATISALAVRKKGISEPQPTALLFNIYTNENANLRQAIQAATYGYIGVVADTRGKRLSPDDIVPYEYEAKDVNAVMDWISKQAWSDGRVAMYGGSYSGFAQWAATKYMHPALKTIVPYVAAIPGLGLPMENNIFLIPNYYWPFYVTNNKYLDNEAYSKSWVDLGNNWYQSGKPYRDIDKVDGTPNPLLQRWLDHPAYDEYWQSMVPYKEDYKNIDIPVLTITGYYDDGQISALHYLNEHYKYNKNAQHYLIIGPYDHFGAQSRPAAVLRGYKIDPVAQINTPEITFQWFDYVLKGGEKPALIKDKVNYQLMGSNTWQHAPSLAELNEQYQRFYLGTANSGKYHQLMKQQEKSLDFLTQEVDLKDRKATNNDYYPWPIIKDKLDVPNGFAFVSEPFDKDVEISGSFSGNLKVRINKKDFDFGLVFYELMSDGRAFHLSYHLGRASYAHDMTKRELLTPNKIGSIPFAGTRMVSKRVEKGSRLVVLVNVNKNTYAQINYGTGKDVSDESIADAKEPLIVHWFNDSYINVPLKN